MGDRSKMFPSKWKLKQIFDSAIKLMLTQKMKNMLKIYSNIKEIFIRLKKLNGVNSGQNMCFEKKNDVYAIVLATSL